MKEFNPFFSIIIPTKNRSELLRVALLSIKEQKFDSYELIVIDNDDSNNTKKVCDDIPNDRMKYVRTGGFTMFENWEFGASHAKGKWILVLEDKQALYSGSLGNIAKILNSNNIKTSLCFNGDYFNDSQYKDAGVVARVPETGEVSKKNSHEVISDYERYIITHSCSYDVVKYIPKPHTSVVLNELFQNTKKEFGEYFGFAALDFNSGLKKLLLSKEIFHADISVYIVTTMRESNGLYSTIYREDAHARDIKMASNNYKAEICRLPFDEFSTTNVFLVDYITLRKKIDKDFLFKLDLAAYLFRIFTDIYNIHAISNKVPLKNSLEKFMSILYSSELPFYKKVIIFSRMFMHFSKTNLHVGIVHIKHSIVDRIFKGSKVFYHSPLDYIRKRG